MDNLPDWTDFLGGMMVRMSSVEGMEENLAVSERGGWMNEVFRSKEVLGNKPCQREKEDILMKQKKKKKKKNDWVFPDEVKSSQAF